MLEDISPIGTSIKEPFNQIVRCGSQDGPAAVYWSPVFGRSVAGQA